MSLLLEAHAEALERLRRFIPSGILGDPAAAELEELERIAHEFEEEADRLAAMLMEANGG